MYRMKNLLFTALLAGAVLLAGCTDNNEVVPSSDFTLTFRALYDGQPLEKSKPYDYDTYKVHFTRFNAYFSDITLLSGAKEVKISTVNWTNFLPDLNPGNLAVEVPITFKNVPDGDYTGIRIGYGVNPSQNAKTPANFSSSDPLGNDNEYWPGWKSYIFNKIEGKADLDNSGGFKTNLSFHCGSNAVYRQYSFNTPIKVGQGATASVELDLKKLFTINGAWFDITIPANQRTSDTAGEVTVATVLMDNFGFATTVKQ